MFNSAVNIPGSHPTLNHAAQGNINYNIYHGPGSNGLEGFALLLTHVATKALHNSGEVSDAPKCHPGTRVAILDTVFAWASATVYLIAIQWIHGPAGAGKSAILRTLAERLARHGLLLASFFFFRAAAGRNSADLFIPTIAYQIARSIPSTRRHIEQAVNHDPLIFSQSLEAQAQALIINPLTQAHEEGSIKSQYPRIILVDGLDECQGEEKQREVLWVLNDVLLKLPIPFAILVASRPEPHIRDTFNTDLNKTSSRVVLDDSYEPDEDIRKYYEDKFQAIRDRHPLRSHFPKPWPPPSVINILVGKASGQFIFPSTVIRFVEPHRHNPLQRLDMVMGSISPGKLRPFEALDNFYSTIFASIEQQNLDAILTILGVLLIPHNLQHNIVDIRRPDLLMQVTGYGEIEIRQMLFDLESLLHVTMADTEGAYVHIYHASLADFLFDRHRSGRFFVDPLGVYGQLARRSVATLVFSGDYTASLSILFNFETFLHKVGSTEELTQTLNNCTPTRLSQLSDKKALIAALGLFCNVILPAISSSALPDAESLCTHLLATLREFVAPKLDSCFDTKVTPLLVEWSHLLSPSNPRIFDIRSTQVVPVTTGDRRTVVVANQGQNGFCLTPNHLFHRLVRVVAFSEKEFEQSSALIRDTIEDWVGECYADFATYTLKWLFHVSNETRSLDDLRAVARKLIPTLLAKSRPRSDVLRLTRDNPPHPILEEIPEYVAAVQHYRSRYNVASGHR